MLHVPALDCNLLSISKLTRDNNCVTKFFPNLCEFQDLDSGKVIGSAEMCSGLYLIKDHTSLDRQTLNANCVSSKSQFLSKFLSNKDHDIMLWHFRLGHPNFMYLEKLFPSMFINKSSVYQLSNLLTCQTYPYQLSKYPI